MNMILGIFRKAKEKKKQFKLHLMHGAKFNMPVKTFGKPYLGRLAWTEALTRHSLQSALMDQLNHLGPWVCHQVHFMGPNVWIIIAGPSQLNQIMGR